MQVQGNNTYIKIIEYIGRVLVYSLTDRSTEDKRSMINSSLALCGYSSKMEFRFPNKRLSCRQIFLRKPAQQQAAKR